MNRTAAALGLTHTHYENPIGLDSASNYSTAADLAALALRLRREPIFRRIVDTPSAVLRTGEWMIIHRCTRCGELTSNPICGDDNQLILMRMAVRPLAQPPFPLEAFGDL